MSEPLMQEVWITIRLKGEMNAALDADSVAAHVLQHIEKMLEPADSVATFSVCQPGDVLEVEEEAQIYDNVSPDTEESLIAELRGFQERNGLPYQCAVEQQNEDITEAQRAWLVDYCARWDRAVESAAHA